MIIQVRSIFFMPFSEYQLLRQKTGYPSEKLRNVPLCDILRGRRTRFLRLRKHPIPQEVPHPFAYQLHLRVIKRGLSLRKMVTDPALKKPLKRRHFVTKICAPWGAGPRCTGKLIFDHSTARKGG